MVRPHIRASARATIGLLGVVLREPDLRRIQVASLVSATARWAYLVALLVVAFRMAGPLGLALLGIVRTVPTMIAVPLAGAAGSRMTGRRLLVLTYAARAVALTLSAAGALAGVPLLVFGPAAIDAVLGTLRRPVQAALLPLVTRTPGELVAANTATTTGDGLAGIAGPLLGAFLLAAGGPAAVLALSAAGFLVAAGLASRISVQGGATGAATASTLRILGGGARALLGSPIPRLVTAGFIVQVVVRGALNVLLVPASASLFGAGGQDVGQLFAAMGVGGVIGGIAATVAIGPGRLTGTFIASLFGWGLPLIVIGFVTSM
ncbi:MAG: hypothetical protein WCK58_15030, partial [Chloroflexota bacterium]